MKPLLLGALLTTVNMAIVALLLYANLVRYLRQRKERHRKKARQAQHIEWAVRGPLFLVLSDHKA